MKAHSHTAHKGLTKRKMSDFIGQQLMVKESLRASAQTGNSLVPPSKKLSDAIETPPTQRDESTKSLVTKSPRHKLNLTAAVDKRQQSQAVSSYPTAQQILRRLN